MSEPYRTWQCATCGHIYSEQEGAPAEGLKPGTRWQDVPETWICPLCGTPKARFAMIEI